MMPIGDSITAGYTDNPNWNVGFEFGYRSGLYQRLTDAGVSVQMVGESTEPWVSPFPGDPTQGGTYTPPLDLRDLDQDYHRGYGGVAAPFVLDRIGDTPEEDGWLTVDDPDVVLIHLGTNGQLPIELNQILDHIVTERPDVHVLFAQIIPKRDFLPGIVSYNNYLKIRVMPNYISRGANVTLVDHYTPFLIDPDDPASIDTSLFATGNHPNAAGYEVMAETWFDALQTVLAEPVLVGDYNADGVVDAADYTVWRDALGQPGSSLPNRSPASSGPIGADDLIAWQAAYGSLSQTITVPEPNATILLSLTIASVLINRRSRVR